MLDTVKKKPAAGWGAASNVRQPFGDPIAQDVNHGHRCAPSARSSRIDWDERDASSADALLRTNAVGHRKPPWFTGRRLHNGPPVVQRDTRKSTVHIAFTCHSGTCGARGRVLLHAIGFQPHPDMPAAYSSFSERLRIQRKRRKLDQAELGQALGIPQSTVSDLENEKYAGPSIEQLAAICAFFDVSADYMLGRTDFENGLPRDSFLVDLDIFEQLPPGRSWAVKIPPRPALVGFTRWQEMTEDVARRERERDGKRKGR